MPVTVRIPTPLRRMTNGQDKVELEESNLSTLIENLEASYPGVKERLIDENGELRYFVNIYLNGEASASWTAWTPPPPRATR